MKKIKNLRDLLLEEGRELYDSNQQELKELPKFERRAVSNDLKRMIKKQVLRTEKEQEYLATAFKNLNAKCEGSECKTTETILKESRNMLENSMDREVWDAEIISSLQVLGHRKIAGFGTSAAYAKAIGEETAAEYFHHALEEEKGMDLEFNQLAQNEFVRMAARDLTS